MLNLHPTAQETDDALVAHMRSTPLLAEIKELIDRAGGVEGNRHDAQDVYAWLLKHPQVVYDPNLFIYIATFSSEKVAILLSFVLRLGANINAVNADGQNVLHILAHLDRNKALPFLLKNGVEQRPDVFGFTPLHVAINAMNVEAVRALIHHPSANTANTLEGETVMQYAMAHWQGRTNLKELLLALVEFEHGTLVPNLDVATLVTLIYTEALGINLLTQIANLLIAKADIPTLQQHLQRLQEIENETTHRNIAIEVAIHEGREDVFRWLLATRNIDLKKSGHEKNCITAAIIGNQLRMLRLLLRSLAEGGFGLSLDAETAVIAAIQYGRVEMLHELIKTSDDGFCLPLKERHPEWEQQYLSQHVSCERSYYQVVYEYCGPVGLAIETKQPEVLRALVYTSE